MKATASLSERGTITGCRDESPHDMRVLPTTRPSASSRSSSPNLPTNSWYAGSPMVPSESRSGAPFTSVLMLKKGEETRRRGGLQVSPSSSEVVRLIALPTQPPAAVAAGHRIAQLADGTVKLPLRELARHHRALRAPGPVFRGVDRGVDRDVRRPFARPSVPEGAQPAVGELDGGRAVDRLRAARQQLRLVERLGRAGAGGGGRRDEAPGTRRVERAQVEAGEHQRDRAEAHPFEPPAHFRSSFGTAAAEWARGGL